MSTTPISPKQEENSTAASTTPTGKTQRRALALLALAAALCLARLAMPVGIGLFLGVLLAFTLQPIYTRLRRRRIAPGPSALICSLGATGTLTVAVAFGAELLVSSAVTLFGTVKLFVAPDGPMRPLVTSMLARLTALHVNADDLYSRLENQVLGLGSSAAGLAADIAGLTFSSLLALFFTTMASYFVLRHWSEIVVKAEQTLPFDRRHTHALLGQLRTVGRQVLLGTIATGILQGFFAAVGYWLTGVPSPVFFGALTALSSLIPAVGSVLVWSVIGGVLLLTGRVAAGLALLTYSALIVGILTDYVIRPRIVGSEKGVPALFMFIALFGGIEVFGVIGLVLGPVIVTLSLAVLRTYANETLARTRPT